jgi:AraC-like DNA-binding protein
MQFAQKEVYIGDTAAMRGTLSGADVLEYGEAADSSWDATCVQLGAGILNATIDFLAGPDFLLYQESWGQRFHNLGVMRHGKLAFGIPEQTGNNITRFWGRPRPSNRLPFVRSNKALDMITSPGETLIVLEITEVEFHRIFQQLTGREAARFLESGDFILVSESAIAGVLDFWKFVLNSTQSGAVSRFGKVDLVASLVRAMNVPEVSSMTNLRTKVLVERVLLEAEASRYQYTVPELSVRLGFSRRSIEYAFREHLGTSPEAYFRLRRLNRCHLELARADPDCETVTDIVTRCGFYQPGRFATIYRQYFGERPSETLKKPSPSVPVAIDMR